jgi:hypothetical protein
VIPTTPHALLARAGVAFHHGGPALPWLGVKIVGEEEAAARGSAFRLSRWGRDFFLRWCSGKQMNRFGWVGRACFAKAP